MNGDFMSRNFTLYSGHAIRSRESKASGKFQMGRAHTDGPDPPQDTHICHQGWGHLSNGNAWHVVHSVIRLKTVDHGDLVHW